MFTAFIPAKGTSERVHNKNLQEINGKCLVQISIDYAIKSNLISQIVVSTESLEIVRKTPSLKMVAELFDMALADELVQIDSKLFIHKRKSSESEPRSLTIDSVLSFLSTGKNKNEYFLLLQPTSPFREHGELENMKRILFENPGSGIVSVKSVQSPHPEKTFKVMADTKVIESNFNISKLQMPAQALGSYYCLDGAFYLSNVENLIKNRSFVNEATITYERFGSKTLNIDTNDDLDYARFIVNQTSNL